MFHATKQNVAQKFIKEVFRETNVSRNKTKCFKLNCRTLHVRKKLAIFFELAIFLNWQFFQIGNFFHGENEIANFFHIEKKLPI